MMYAGRMIMAVVVLATSVTALPNHLKAVVVDTDSIAKGTSVSASFGPYTAKAGLGGSGGSGGVFAAADSPHGSASAGLGGSVAEASPTGGLGASATTGNSGTAITSGGHKPSHGHHQPGLFDGIFNIPISVLQSVNTYLNNRGPITKPVHRRRGHEPSVYKTVTPEQSNNDGQALEKESDSGNKIEASAGAEAGSQSFSGSVQGSGVAHSGQGPVVIHKRVNYDDIFNIPISVLKSVNQLLNGKK